MTENKTKTIFILPKDSDKKNQSDDGLERKVDRLVEWMGFDDLRLYVHMLRVVFAKSPNSPKFWKVMNKHLRIGMVDAMRNAPEMQYKLDQIKEVQVVDGNSIKKELLWMGDV